MGKDKTGTFQNSDKQSDGRVDGRAGSQADGQADGRTNSRKASFGDGLGDGPTQSFGQTTSVADHEAFHQRARISSLRQNLFPANTSETEGKQTEAKKRPPSITIGKTREEVFNFISEPTNFSKFMTDIQSVQRMGDKALHFTVMSEKGMKSEFSAEVITNRPNECYAWQLTESPRDIGAITVESAAGGRGTVVSLKQGHETLLEKFTGFAASLVGKNPQLRAAMDLMRLKAYLETGEVPTILGQPNGNDEQKQ